MISIFVLILFPGGGRGCFEHFRKKSGPGIITAWRDTFETKRTVTDGVVSLGLL